MRWILLMSLTVCFWAGAFIAGKLGLRTASPLALTYGRFVVGVACLFLYARYKGISLRIQRKDGWDLALLGLVGMTGYHLLFFQALRHTTAVKAAMIGATNPLMSAILAALFLGERLSGRRILLILTAFTGVLLTISKWDLGLLLRTGPSLGDALMVCAVLCWASYAILVRRLVTRFDPIVTTFYSFLTCVLILTPFQGVELLTRGLAIDASGWLSILYMGLFPTFIGYLVQQQAIKHIGVSRTALFINLVPILVMLLAVLVLGEPFFRLNLVSAAMIILSVAGFNLASPGRAGSGPQPAAGPGDR